MQLAGQGLAEAPEALALFRAPGAGILLGLVEFLVDALAQLLVLARQGAAQPLAGPVQFVAGLPERGRHLVPVDGQFLPEAAFQPLAAALQMLEATLQVGKARAQPQKQAEQ